MLADLSISVYPISLNRKTLAVILNHSITVTYSHLTKSMSSKTGTIKVYYLFEHLDKDGLHFQCKFTLLYLSNFLIGVNFISEQGNVTSSLDGS